MSSSRNFLEFDHEFPKLRLSAMMNAMQVSTYVNDITIGPNRTIDEEAIDESKSKIKDLNNPRIDIKSDAKCKNNKGFNADVDSSSYDRLIYEYKNQRREAIKLVNDNMLRKMATKRAEFMNSFWHKQSLEYERKTQERRKLEMMILQECAADDNMARIEQEKLDMENRAHSERMKKLLENQLESTKLFEKLNEVYSNICEQYQSITTICSDKAIGSKVYYEFEPAISNVLSSINSVIENCKTGNITAQNITIASALENKIVSVKNAIEKKLRDALNELQNKVPTEAAKQISEPVAEPKQDVKRESLEKTVKLNQYFSRRSRDRYVQLRDFLIEYENSYRDLLQDQSLKKFRFDCQKAVNTPVNAISSLNGAHIRDKFDKLTTLLNGDRVMVGDMYISTAQHPQAKAYCTDLLARKIVRQGELLVSSHPEAAFPLASVAIALWARFPDFGKLMCAHFYNSCPYLIPMMMPQLAGETDEEFYKKRGYKYSEEGVIEKQDQFLKRISGIFRLYAAMWITKMPRCLRMAHPQNLSHAWQWFAAFVNLNPEIDISATILCEFLTICGSDFMKCYRRQFNKVLKYLISDYMSELSRIDNGGPKTRLDVFVQGLEKNNRIQPPVGLLSDHFW